MSKSKELKLIDILIRTASLYRDTQEKYEFARENAVMAADNTDATIKKITDENSATISRLINEYAELKEKYERLQENAISKTEQLTTANRILNETNGMLERIHNIVRGSVKHEEIKAYLIKYLNYEG